MDNLQSEIMSCIVERLPLRDAARMSVVSHKWRHAWISTPQLVLDSNFFFRVLNHGRRSETNDKFYRIVSNILLVHTGPVFKFSLYLPSKLKNPHDITQWLSNLSRKGVREFTLQNHARLFLQLRLHLFSCVELQNLHLLRCHLSLPSNFMGCRTLENLKLEDVKLEIPPNFTGFSKLKKVDLDRFILVASTFNHLFTSCSLLESLTITDCEGLTNVYLDAPNLKQLTLDGTIKSLGIQNVENLVSASIILEKLTNSKDVIKALEKAAKLQKLCLGGCFCKVLFKDCIRSLKLSDIRLDDADDLPSVVRAIKSCPNVEELSLSVDTIENVELHPVAHDSSCKFLQLRNITAGLHSECDFELKLMEFLLASSPNLELLSVRLGLESDPNAKSRFSKNFTHICKAFPDLNVVISINKEIESGYYYSSPDWRSGGNSDSEDSAHCCFIDELE